ncbi:MAG: 50S ribosomal protein L2 [Puniceicoccaceae bacterium]
MATIQSRPITPGQRYLARNKQDLYKGRPETSLTSSHHSKKGRNVYGRITSRRRGGGHKRLYRQIDFKRDKFLVPGKVERIEYDPNRSANIALIFYADGEKRYIIAPNGLEAGATVMNHTAVTDEFNPGDSYPLALIPPATSIHCIEMEPGRGARLVRGAGGSAQLVNVDQKIATIKLPSGEIRLINSACRATIGRVGNVAHDNQSLGKAGRNRWKGRRPRVRGVAMNPVDHPMGGGEGRTSGGGHPVSPWGQLSKGYPTRTRSKTSNSQILVRRNGRRLKR